MPKTSNEETSFSLAYGTEAVILAEIGMPTRRTAQRADEENDVELRMNLNLLEERREITMTKEARRKKQVENYYKQRVHHKQFRTGEFVLQKIKFQRQRTRANLDQNGKAHTKSSKHTAHVLTSSRLWMEQKCRGHGIQAVYENTTCNRNK
ncbi:hypothetical protein Tco_1429326 [Tanacetum coccineum]